ncbi:MAG: membrane protein insertase YidC [Candidatus Omnitrophica bacterium]|nr:membrane protein insertase YidC [Candidatus Omnitrophota bacterium]
MEKRLLYAFLLSLLFLIGYSVLAPKYLPKTPPTASSSSSTPVQEVKEEPKESPLNLPEKENLSQVRIGNFDVTYSTTGGYIKKLLLLKYQEELSFKNIGFIPQDRDKKFSAQIAGNSIIFTAENGEKKEFYFDGYILKITLPSSLQGQAVLFSNSLSSNMLEQGYQELFFVRENDIRRENFKKVKNESYENVNFAGSRSQYFCISLLKGKYSLKTQKTKTEVELFLSSPSSSISLYIGPQTTNDLKQHGLEGVLNYGFFNAIGVILAWFLHLFYSWTKSWGLSIILLTTFSYIVLFPFTMQSTKAMKKMAQVQPELDKLKSLYKDNMAKLQKEQAELFKKYKINPLGGCLPLLFQMPVFFALLQVFMRFVEVKGVSFLWIKDLTLPDRILKLPMTIPFVGEYLNLLPLLMVALTLVQQKITTPATNKEQQSMALFFAIFMGVMFYNFAACLTLYWFIQNLLTFAYQLKVAKFQHSYACERA